MELLNRVIRLLPFIPNGKSGVDIRSIHNLEKLTGYCTKQFEWHRPSYEVIDPVSSDVDVSHYLHYKQNEQVENQTRDNTSKTITDYQSKVEDPFWRSLDLHTFIEEES